MIGYFLFGLFLMFVYATAKRWSRWLFFLIFGREK